MTDVCGCNVLQFFAGFLEGAGRVVGGRGGGGTRSMLAGMVSGMDFTKTLDIVENYSQH